VGNLDTLQALASGGDQTRFLRGTVVKQQGATSYSVSVNGSVIPVSAAESVAVVAGDNVLVAWLMDQKEAIVVCRLSDTLHPATGTVATVPVGSQTITVTGADGTTYTAYAMSGYSPTVGDNVEMLFLGGAVYVSKTNPTPAAPTVVTTVAPPSTGPSTGTSPFAASDSSTWWGPGGWGSWDTYSQPSGVFQGDYGSGPLTGAWFYAGAPGQIQGRTILGGRVVVGPRLQVGSYNNALSVNLYTHSSPNRPGGNVSLVNGPTVVTAQPWQGLTTYTLTAAQATDLVNGGGIAITGGSYLGFAGIAVNAQSGTVYIDWSR
jgi:hypothetical protein